MDIVIGNDHSGVQLKNRICELLESNELKVLNIGTNNNSPVDYTDITHQAAELVAERKINYGILICGSAQGVTITANKHTNVNAVVCWNPKVFDFNRNSDVNIICLLARFITTEDALCVVSEFIKNLVQKSINKSSKTDAVSLSE